MATTACEKPAGGASSGGLTARGPGPRAPGSSGRLLLVGSLWARRLIAPTTTGRQASTGQTLTLVPDIPDPANPAGALTGRLTSDRFEMALLTVVNSVVFRSSGRDLTTAGTYTWVEGVVPARRPVVARLPQ
ncbi:hypothetical protein GCM10018980_74300 [Streptomyces capoamus]|uniref:Uncharacterized protein n=1 Tax=Streptomyces capoamus TaxID=68183 RepID=A0A919F3K3_9ACTN|nr:hypothetical protein [Streptomyces capoamus]GGP32697.1 hypothetical protein GCM10010501_75560 [Streptomyces libani subsp. rufus]GHG76397.1 hypothetical protein GCM10018980_74300 [Streptomyces capoamus]